MSYVLRAYIPPPISLTSPEILHSYLHISTREDCQISKNVADDLIGSRVKRACARLISVETVNARPVCNESLKAHSPRWTVDGGRWARDINE